ncbi:3925_t:CDS:2, partial [Paraglomus occultum]
FDSYHVYNLKNREKVRRDEEKAQAEDEAKAERAIAAEREYRLNLLRQRAKQEPVENTQNAKENLDRQAEETSSQHVNLWAELEEKSNKITRTNPEYESEKKAKEDKWERNVTMYLDNVTKISLIREKDAKRPDASIYPDQSPWYNAKSTDVEIGPLDKDGEKRKAKTLRDEKTKTRQDPLLTISTSLSKRHKKSKYSSISSLPSSSKHSQSSPSSSQPLSTIEKLRQERLERENQERLRTERLLSQISGHSKSADPEESDLPRGNLPITNDASKNENQESSERRLRTKDRKNKAQQKELVDDTLDGEEEEYVMSHYDKPLKDIPPPLPSSSYSSPSSHASDLSNLKERFNYASHVCASMILNTNRGAKFAHAILTESKDQYMLNECDSEKFVVVELCNDILIDTIVLANFEFFSSTFKHIKIYANNEHPPRKERPWRLLGEYKAENTRELQVFKVKDPLLWARYIRIDFVSHYGRQFFCPVSLLRVHGVTMFEDYKRQEEQSSTPPPSDITAKINRTDDDDDFIDYLKTEEATLEMIDKKLSGESEGKGGEGEKSERRNGGNGKNEGSSPGNDLGSEDDRKKSGNELRGEIDRETNSGERNLHGDDDPNLLHPLFGFDSLSTLQCPRLHDEKGIFSYPLCKITDDPYYFVSFFDNARRMIDYQHTCLKDQCGLYEENCGNTRSTGNSAVTTPSASPSTPSPSLSTPLSSSSPSSLPQISPSSHQPPSQEVASPRIQKEDSDTQSVYQKFLKRFSDLELNALAAKKSMESQSKMLKDVLNKIQTQQFQILGFMTELNHNVTGLEYSTRETKAALARVENTISEHAREIRLLSKQVELYAEISTLEYVVIVWLIILTLVMVAVLCNYYISQKFLDTVHGVYRMIINAMKVSVMRWES